MKKFYRRQYKGFTLVEIMIVVAIIGIIVAIAVPGFIKAREQSRTRGCQENLTKIDGAKEQWALETNQKVGAACVISNLLSSDGTPTGYLKYAPVCPEDNQAYTINPIGSDPKCTGGYTNHSLSSLTAAN
jgi:prepilin-type N-terminal cleavage/methylation domain-containing protein